MTDYMYCIWLKLIYRIQYRILRSIFQTSSVTWSAWCLWPSVTVNTVGRTSPTSCTDWRARSTPRSTPTSAAGGAPSCDRDHPLQTPCLRYFWGFSVITSLGLHHSVMYFFLDFTLLQLYFFVLVQQPSNIVVNVHSNLTYMFCKLSKFPCYSQGQNFLVRQSRSIMENLKVMIKFHKYTLSI